MLFCHVVDGLADLHNVPLGLLYRGAAVRFPRPSHDVAAQLVVLALLLLDVLTQLADFVVPDRVIDELEPACLARPVLLVALLPKVTPPPIPASPACLIEEAHGILISVRWFGPQLWRREKGSVKRNAWIWPVAKGLALESVIDSCYRGVE